MNEDLKPKKKTLRSIKHSGGIIQLWGCFAALGPGEIVRIKGIMDKEEYMVILKAI